MVGDITDAAVVAQFHQAAVEFGDGRVDVLVNNVGDYRPGVGKFIRTTEADWDAQIDITFRHVLRCTHSFLPTMVEGGGGTIVNVSTVEAMRAMPRIAVYSASNAAIIAFTRSIALEMADQNIRVNCHCPRHGRHPANPPRPNAAGPSPRASDPEYPLVPIRQSLTTSPRWPCFWLPTSPVS